jgi:hypothetical protein
MHHYAKLEASGGVKTDHDLSDRQMIAAERVAKAAERSAAATEEQARIARAALNQQEIANHNSRRGGIFTLLGIGVACAAWLVSRIIK